MYAFGMCTTDITQYYKYTNLQIQQKYAGKNVKFEEKNNVPLHISVLVKQWSNDVEEVHLVSWMPPYFSNTLDVFLTNFWCISHKLLKKKWIFVKALIPT